MNFTVRPDLAKVVRDWQAGDTTWTDRLSDYYLPSEIFARCEVSLDCIDCYTRQDVMGDDQLHTSQYDAVHLQCLECHGTKERPFIRHKGDNWIQSSRVTGKTFNVPLVFGSQCQQVPDEQGADS